MTTITFHSDNTSRQRREAMMFGLLRVAAASIFWLGRRVRVPRSGTGARR